jgi:hypothetical protein
MRRPHDDLGRLGTAAVRYAEHGWPVIPLATPTGPSSCSCSRGPACGSPGKHPRVASGLHEATTDVATVTSWWRRWPDANIGVATGPASGLLVLDVDLPLGPRSLERLEQTHGTIPTTCAQRTGSGGQQLLLRYPDVPVGNRAGLEPGIDVRGDGGYVVVPPSLHASHDRYVWTIAAPIATTPDWLVALANRERGRHLTAVTGDENGRPIARPTAYGSAALDGELALLARAVPGTRNDTLNRAAFRLGQLVADGALQPDHVARCLRIVSDDIGLGEDEADRTIASGLAAGARTPRGLSTEQRGGPSPSAGASIAPLVRGPRVRRR